MKKIRIISIALCALIMLNSCATIMGGKVTAEQKRKPGPGEPQRQVRAGYLVADILFGIIPVFVDFGTGAIYKPSPTAKPVAKGDANGMQP